MNGALAQEWLTMDPGTFQVTPPPHCTDGSGRGVEWSSGGLGDVLAEKAKWDTRGLSEVVTHPGGETEPMTARKDLRGHLIQQPHL